MSNYIDRDDNEFLTVDGVKTSDNIKRIFDYGYLKYKPCFSKEQRETYLNQIVIPVIQPDPYLTFRGNSLFQLGLNNSFAGWDGTVEYSTDAETWVEWSDPEFLISSNSNNELYLRGTNTTFYDLVEDAGTTLVIMEGSRAALSSLQVECIGNIETLLNYQTVLNGDHPVMGEYCFCALFADCDTLTTAPTLPATTLAEGCYSDMFSHCTSLTTAPALPATTLAEYCYTNMFLGCTSLTTAPSLPATTLQPGCYESMFAGSSLTSAPTLPATTLTEFCYESMFADCTTLTAPPTLPATTLAEGCYESMFSGCTSLTVAPALPATTLAYGCYDSMFFGCTSFTTAPELPATTLADYCYQDMFYGCTSLETPPALPATTLEEGCYYEMFYGCYAMKLSDTPTSEYTKSYRIPTTGTGVDATAAMANMFVGTGGTFTGTPTINDTYYLWNPVPYLIFSSEDPFTLGVSSKNWNGTLQYSLNTRNWFTWTGSPALSSNSNNELYLRGTNNTILGTTFTLTATSGVSCIGNIENLLNYQTVLNGEHPVMGNQCFHYLFQNCRSLTTAPELPTTDLSPYCYSDMFALCTSLTAAPTLPATTLADYCYERMFRGCTSLVSAPALPATTLTDHCYSEMFSGCTSLTTAPQLPATTLKQSCYANMFKNCTSLAQTPSLPATTLTSSCYGSMFDGCTSLITVPELPATTLSSYCYSSMFKGCTSLTTLPQLPATTLSSNCYQEMFYGCTSIKISEESTSEYTIPYRIPTTGTGTSSTNSLTRMFVGTGGAFAGTPTINNPYYLWENPAS